MAIHQGTIQIRELRLRSLNGKTLRICPRNLGLPEPLSDHAGRSLQPSLRRPRCFSTGAFSWATTRVLSAPDVPWSQLCAQRMPSSILQRCSRNCPQRRTFDSRRMPRPGAPVMLQWLPPHTAGAFFDHAGAVRVDKVRRSRRLERSVSQVRRRVDVVPARSADVVLRACRLWRLYW